MKTLIVYDKDGNIVFTSGPADSIYSLFVQDIDTNRIPIGVDLENNKAVTVAEDASETQKNKIINELKKKNELYNLKEDLSETKQANEELNDEIKKQINELKKSDLEILDYVDCITNTEE